MRKMTVAAAWGVDGRGNSGDRELGGFCRPGEMENGRAVRMQDK